MRGNTYVAYGRRVVSLILACGRISLLVGEPGITQI